MKIQDHQLVSWCRAMEILLTAGVLFLPLLGQAVLWVSQHHVDNIMVLTGPAVLTPTEYAVMSLTGLTSDVVQSYIIWQFVMVFRSIRLGDVFGSGMIKWIRHAGIGFLLSPLVVTVGAFVQSIFISGENFTLMINDLNCFLLGSGLLILSHVIALGKAVQDENRLVI